MRSLLATLAAYAAAAAVLAGSLPASAVTLPPCPTEDSLACVWIAPEHGNGQGRSFTTDRTGRVYMFGAP